MRRAAMLCVVAAGLPTVANAQLEVRHNSRVEIIYEDPYTMLEDTIAGETGYEPFSLSHSVTYDDDFLDFDPTASSTFSVDSVEFVSFNGSGTTQAFYDITITGELFRSGVGPGISGQFARAQPEVHLDIVGLPDLGPFGITMILQYTVHASFVSDVDLSTYASRPLISIQNDMGNGTIDEVYAFEASGSSGSETFVGGFINGAALRLNFIADPYEILVSHEGHTTVTFEATFRVLTRPEPCLADVNGDGEVTPADFSAWVAAFNSGAPECDQNGDELCTPADFSAWVANFNAGCD